MSRADDYNRREFEAGRITYEHVDAVVAGAVAGHMTFVEAVRASQAALGLVPDGKLGPLTRAALVQPVFPPLVDLTPLRIDRDGWAIGAGVRRVPMHSSWYLNAYWSDGPMKPEGWVDHYSVTGPGSAKAMADKRRDERRGQTKTGWHFTIEADGEIWQQAPCDVQMAHAGHTWANEHTIGIEYVSRDGSYFTPEQVVAGARLCRALVERYATPREHAGIPHSSLHPSHTDPGPVWAAEHRDRVIAYAYGGGDS